VKKLKQILTGVSGYGEIRRSNGYFVDRTNLIADLEQTRFALFLRPRRFGKSLWTSILRAYCEINRGDGFFKRFFIQLKAVTTGLDAPMKRLFVTGVTPVTMDDVTSGFNIGTNLTLHPISADMMGFTHDDVKEMLAYYRDAGALKLDVDDPLPPERLARLKADAAAHLDRYAADRNLAALWHLKPNGPLSLIRLSVVFHGPELAFAEVA